MQAPVGQNRLAINQPNVTLSLEIAIKRGVPSDVRQHTGIGFPLCKRLVPIIA